MHRRLALVSLLLVLIGCNPDSDISLSQELETQAIVVTGIAWNERVELNVGSNNATSIIMQVKKGGHPLTNPVTVVPIKRGNVVIFDLPNVPPFPFIGIPVTADDYKNRGTVFVTVNKANGQKVDAEYTPFGSVVNRQINVLLPFPSQGTCPAKNAFFRGLKVVNSFSTNADSTALNVPSRLCFLTLDIGATTSDVQPKGTSQAISELTGLENELAISRNILFSMDSHRPTYTTTPSCEQLEHWTQTKNSNFQRFDTTKILAEVNASAAHTKVPPIKGTGVTVAVIGSGVDTANLTYPAQVRTGYNFVDPAQTTNTSDDFWCDFDKNGTHDVEDHDTHVAEIISTIAPDAVIRPFKVCSHDGDCSSAYVSMAVMYLMKNYSGTLIVNTSLGGDEGDHTLSWLLQNDPNYLNEKLFIVASDGNNGVEVPHYPATYSPLSTPLGHNPLANFNNVISVAAVGLTDAGYLRANFNTRKNLDIYALGINMCPASVTLQCQGTTDPGIGGTSFSAPIVAGVAALYAQAQPGANLYTLLTGSTQPVPGATLGRVWYQ
jgi:subtilisin family serine protease